MQHRDDCVSLVHEYVLLCMSACMHVLQGVQGFYLQPCSPKTNLVVVQQKVPNVASCALLKHHLAPRSDGHRPAKSRYQRPCGAI